MPKTITFLLLLFFLIPQLRAQNCVDAHHCRSQLIRVEITNDILNTANNNLLPGLNNLAQSNALHSLIERSFPLDPVDFPPNPEACEREKAAHNPNFAAINCRDMHLCNQPNLNAEVRERMCFHLPCPIFEGTLNVGKCNSQENLFPTSVAFPAPLQIQRLRMTPTRVDFSPPVANLCFMINELALNMSVRLNLDTTRTRLPDNNLTIGNINPVFNQPREMCITADINTASPHPVSNIRVIPKGNAPFISDALIRSTAHNLTISGLSGYPASQLDAVKDELVPVIVQPIRDSVENAVKDALGGVFETEINRIVGGPRGTTSTMLNSTAFSSELGLGNLQVRDQVSRLECSALHAAGQPIPPTHACIGLPDFVHPIDTTFSSPTINELMSMSQIAAGKQLTSESIKQRLMAVRDLLLQEPPYALDPNDHSRFAEETRVAQRERIQRDIDQYVNPIIDSISRNQLNTHLFNFVEIQNQLQGGTSRNVGVSIPEICSDTHPSPHARRSIAGCPIQVYADLNEFNQVLRQMWENGQVCMQGRGPYVPAQPQYDSEGKPQGTGCYLEMNGMGCYLNAPPQIRYDVQTRKYKTSVSLKSCYHGPVAFGLGRFGGDFNINYSFSPKACNNGDFCMGDPVASWRVVPGSERFALRPSSPFSEIISGELQNAVNSALGNTIRIPLASGVDALANVPLEAEGRVDAGPGFFGACLRLHRGNRQ